ncbi:hypothetical protein ACLMJK_004279 [Lecanora helva]
MKATFQTLSLLALAIPIVITSPASIRSTDDSINESKLDSDKLSLTELADPSDVAARGKCIDITFVSDNPQWNYKFNGDWGEGSGNVGALNTKTLCGSGAMFVGEQTPANGLGAASGGNTKLECTVKGDGKKDNVCDVSVVDGYSLSMHCTGFPASEIGGTANLFNLGNCPDVNNHGHTCVNHNGHTNNAAQFFKNGGRYWYQDDTAVKTTFKGTPKVKCSISK